MFAHNTTPISESYSEKVLHKSKREGIGRQLPSRPSKIPSEMDNPFQWVCKFRTLVVSYLQHLQNLCDYLLPSVTLVDLLWLLLTICKNFFHPIMFNLQVYLIVIAICWQLSSCLEWDIIR